MTFRQSVAGLALLLIFGALSSARGQTAASPSGPLALQHAVTQALLMAPDLGEYPLTVTVDADSTVTLDGVLPKAQDRTAAENAAKAVPGVAKVSNHIVVNAAASLLNDGTAADPGTLAAMQFRIQNALDSNLALVAVTASVYPQLVALTGYVANAADKTLAASVAQKNAGGVKIANAVAISPANAPSL